MQPGQFMQFTKTDIPSTKTQLLPKEIPRHKERRVLTCASCVSTERRISLGAGGTEPANQMPVCEL